MTGPASTPVTPASATTATGAAALDSARLKAALLHPHGDFGRVEVVASAGSTNTDLSAGAADAQQYWPDLSVLIADAQPAGKGRLGRSWEVPAGAAMISSVLVWPGEQCAASGSGETFAPTGYGWLSILAGMALCQALRTRTAVPATLKWPNDVVVNGRKLAGILAQVVPAATAGPRAQAGTGVVVGVGVNISLREEDLPTDRATSLVVEGVPAPALDRNDLLPAYLNNFAKLYRGFAAAGGDATAPMNGAPMNGAPMSGGASILDQARGLMGTLGQEVRAELPGGTMLYGTAVDLNSDGSLRIMDASGREHTVSAGDVLHLRRTGPDGMVGYA